MTNYWTRHRLIHTLVLSIAIALISALLFVVPYISALADDYNAQSIYKNTKLDFIVPEPSLEQVDALPGTNGIDKIFPYYLTKTTVQVNGKQRTTTVLLSDQFQNIDITMYNTNRLIQKSDEEYSDPILVDWQFCQDTSAKLGDTVSVSISGNSFDFRITAIYETNNIYDGGAVLAEISEEQKKVIIDRSRNNGYSGMYISTSDYNACKTYLHSDYRPLGRLKSREQFKDDEQYQVHYDAIMSSGYANEITDTHVLENDYSKTVSPLMIILGALLSAAIVIAFNVIMANRGCEKGYFTKHCIPKGLNVSSYYTTSFFAEVFLFVLMYSVSMYAGVLLSGKYIHKSAINVMVVAIPLSVVIAEIISLVMNKSKVTEIIRKIEEEKREKERREKERLI